MNYAFRRTTSALMLALAMGIAPQRLGAEEPNREQFTSPKIACFDQTVERCDDALEESKKWWEKLAVGVVCGGMVIACLAK